MRLKLPHISRIITATVLPGAATLFLWTLLISLISFNAFIHINIPLSYRDKLYDVFMRPLSWNAHMRLAQGLWEYGAMAAAKNELAIAAELFPRDSRVQQNAAVLGDTTSPDNLLGVWINEPTRLASEKQYWLGVAATHVDYRDAYVQLARVAYAQGDLLGTKEYLQKAHALDPNGKTVSDLLGFIEKKLE